ncbi:4-alpha-glucanotransferase [Jonesia quinghaiensis]|uniref:4-alpha-glucanotransferase n=1 Tax=Jonesia quinghaiensis TaxID=262806 RepID=UPI0003F5FC99|nr:4-alpha-glucanotransferase [Jonesia quinghaiensis]
MDQVQMLSTVCETYRVKTGKNMPSSAALTKVLGAFGVDVSTPGQLRVTAEAMSDEPWRTMAPPMVVAEPAGATVTIHVFSGDPTTVELEIAGESHALTPQPSDQYVRRIDGVLVEQLTYNIPPALPTGFGTLRVTSAGRSARCVVIVPPHTTTGNHAHGTTPPQDADAAHTLGISWELGCLSSSRGWGIGDYADARDIASWAATLGAHYVLPDTQRLSPRRTWGLPTDASTFHDPLYLRVEDIDEYAYLSTPDRSLITWAKDDPEVGRGLPNADVEALAKAKIRAARVIYQSGLSPARRYAFDSFCVQGGRHLRVFAAWCALVRYAENPWPADRFFSLGDAQLADTSAYHAGDVDFFMWLQWILSEQALAIHQALPDTSRGLVRPLWLSVARGSVEEWFIRGAVVSGTRAATDITGPHGTVVCNPLDLERNGLVQLRAAVRRVSQNCGAIVVQDPAHFFTSSADAAGERVQIVHDARAWIAAVVTEAALAGVQVWVEDHGLTAEQREVLGSFGVVFRSAVVGEGGLDPSFGHGAHVPGQTISLVSQWSIGPLAARLEGVDIQALSEVSDLGAHQALTSARLKQRDAIAQAVNSATSNTPPSTWSLVTDVYRHIAHRGLVDVYLPDAIGESDLTVRLGSTDTRAQARGALAAYPVVALPYRDATGEVLSVDDVWGSARAAYLVNRVASKEVSVSPAQSGSSLGA